MVTMIKMRIMLVDDEERFLQTMQKILVNNGYAVITASSGEECLEKIAKELVHVVILDVKMPGMGGVATLKKIKQLYPMVEVIMLTGHATVESAVEGLKSGASDYLTKPASVEEIIAKAEEAYSRHRGLAEKIRQAEALKKTHV